MGQNPTWSGGILYESEIYFTGIGSGQEKESVWKRAEREKSSKKTDEYKKIESEIIEQKETEKSYLKNLREQYTEETGKLPIISGRKTKHYKNWLRTRKKVEQLKEGGELKKLERQTRERKLVERREEQELKAREEEQQHKHKLEQKKRQSSFKKESKELKKQKKSSKSKVRAKSEIKYCEKCGAELRENAKHCQECGMKISLIKIHNLGFRLSQAYLKKITVEIEGMLSFFLNYDKYNIELSIYIDFKAPEVLDDQKNLAKHIIRISKSFAQKLKVLIQP